jgi:hypothetical protein
MPSEIYYDGLKQLYTVAAEHNGSLFVDQHPSLMYLAAAYMRWIERIS